MPDKMLTTRQDDTLSRIAYDYYGRSSGMVERILEANQNLSHQPALLPAGISINMPAAVKQADIPTLNLWD